MSSDRSAFHVSIVKPDFELAGYVAGDLTTNGNQCNLAYTEKRRERYDEVLCKVDKIMASTDRERMSAQRKARTDAGWVEIRLWAASEADAVKIRTYAEELRMQTLEPALRRIGRERKMSPAVISRALDAFRAQGSREYVTPSGATLELLSDLARAQQLRDANGVFEMFALAHPSNARHVSGQLPAKVVNHFIMSKLDFRGVERLMAWQKKNPQWSTEIQTALDNFSLEAWAGTAVEQIRVVKLS
ncbi:hypothetical protein P3T42_007299 [Paraburkholderia sp. GAS38]|uniref:hypothetical protein n=1 Tax=Paraburkholderia sp. GAS38 TaxID=3035133 RepID=UPI003D22E470